MVDSGISREARALRRAVTIADLRVLARRRLPKPVFDFIDGGAEDERTVRANREDFDRWVLMPRTAMNVSHRDPKVTIMGKPAALPLVLSPTGLAGFYRWNGEIAAVRASAHAGIPYCLSTNSVASLEQVAAAAPDAERWFQLYPLRDREWMNDLVRRAAAASYRALCLTVDLPLSGRRERDIRNGFTVPLQPKLSTVFDLARRPAWLIDAARSRPTFGNFQHEGAGGFTDIVQHVASQFDPTVSWDDIARFREKWRGPMVIKGVLHPADAEKAVGLGIDAVMVSNHGGRQLDHSPSAIAALPEIVAAVGGRCDIILDGGVRRGTDILKARALGATTCSSGRAFLWGLCAGGEAGVTRAISIFRGELDVSMALLGLSSLGDLSADHVRPRGA